MMTRTFLIGRKEAGQTIADVIRNHLTLARPEAQQLVKNKRVRLAGGVCTDLNRRVSAGQRVQVRLDAPTKEEKAELLPKKPKPLASAAGLPMPRIRFADEHVVVVEKPSGLTTVRNAEETAEFGDRAKKYLPATMADLLPALLANQQTGLLPRVRAVHRLDKETSGLVVFARTPEAEVHLGKQFRQHTVERRYLALVRGKATTAVIQSRLVRDRGDGRRGSTTERGGGQHAVTHVEALEEFGAYTLVACTLETGRTHQVRIHLGEAGTPLCGEKLYDRPLNGLPLPDPSGQKRVALHAASLGFIHPWTGKLLRWEAPLPHDMRAFLDRQRRKKRRGTAVVATDQPAETAAADPIEEDGDDE